MKKSKKLSLILMTSMLTTTLTGCGDEPIEVSMFKNQEECVSAGNTAELCAKYEEEARKNAPKFADRAECEKQFGTAMCSGGQDSDGDFWMPAIAGFMIGNMLADRDRGSYPVTATGFYGNPGGGYQTATGSKIDSINGKATVNKSTFSSSSIGRSAVISRGGFGGGARSSSVGG